MYWFDQHNFNQIELAYLAYIIKLYGDNSKNYENCDKLNKVGCSSVLNTMVVTAYVYHYSGNIQPSRT